MIELVYKCMDVYLQSAVVMMDRLTVLSITNHTHKYNNNEVNKNITMFGLHMLQIIPALKTADLKKVATLPAPQEANVQNKLQIPVLADARVPCLIP